MIIRILDQQYRFVEELERLRSTAAMSFLLPKLPEKTTSIDLDIAFPPGADARNKLFSYDIFPPHIMRHLTEWKHEHREMRVGDTILQQVQLPPFPAPSLKIVFGVRIRAIIEEEARIGFSYETLEGHVEKGISTFIVEPWLDRSRFVIHTRSTPTNILARLAGPLFAVPYQTYCTRQALSNFKRTLERN